jgi:hypothetical protein
VSGFSAGYGAIRRILGFHKNYATIDALGHFLNRLMQ